MTELEIKLTEKVASLEEQVAYLKAQLYGSKKEKTLIDNSQLLPQMADYFKDNCPESEESDTSEEVTLKKRKKRKPFSHFSFPENAPRETKIVDLPESEKFDPITGKPLVHIGEDIYEKLVYVPGCYKVVVTRVQKYSVPNKADCGVITAPAPSHPIKGCRADISLLVYVLISKFADHLPLHRIAGMLKRDGLNISRQTLSKWVLLLGTVLQPLANLLRDEILTSSRLFTDDSPVKLQSKGKGKCIEGRVHVYVGGDGPDPPLVWYEFTKDRCHDHILNRMKDFQGSFHADAFAAYEKLNLREGINWQPCWAHARRKFFDVPNPNKFCLSILALIDKLFTLERQVWGLPDKQARKSFRQEKSKVMVEFIFDQIQKYSHENYLPKGKLKTAVRYILSRKQEFCFFLDQPDVRIDNNVSERAIRNLTIGRKNWLFFGSENGGHAASTIMSLIQTCRKLEVNPREYLDDVLRKINDLPADQLHQLLPQNWKK